MFDVKFLHSRLHQKKTQHLKDLRFQSVASFPAVLGAHQPKQKNPIDYCEFKSIDLEREQSQFCKQCHNISDLPLCDICANVNRDKSLVCVVEDIRDVMAIENTSQFKGVYHVLGGKISPMDGIGPHDLTIASLVQKVRSKEIKELIFALSSTMEGDTTNFYIFKQIEDTDVVMTAIARGIAVGDELEYADEVTLGRSIVHRIPFEASFKQN